MNKPYSITMLPLETYISYLFQSVTYTNTDSLVLDQIISCCIFIQDYGNHVILFII